MALKIEDMQGSTLVHSPEEIERALSRRYGTGVNEFWISHGEDRYPVLAIVVNGDLASLSYFPEEGSAGFKSIGNMPSLKKGEFSKFYVNTPTEVHLVLNDSIVSVTAAVELVKDFMADSALPSSIQWVEL